MTANWLYSPPVVLMLFSALVGGFYWLSRRWAARGEDSKGKHMPYACGEDLLPGEVRLSYHSFFRLALMFVVVHMATLVVATLPGAPQARWLASAYLLGIAICVDALARGRE